MAKTISGHSTSAKAAQGTPSRSSRSPAKRRGPLRASDPGVSSPAIRKNRPMANNTAGTSRKVKTVSAAGAILASWTSW